MNLYVKHIKQDLAISVQRGVATLQGDFQKFLCNLFAMQQCENHFSYSKSKRGGCSEDGLT